MDEVKRYVNLSFIVAAIVMSWFLMKLCEWIMGTAGIIDAKLLGEHVTYSTIAGLVLGVVVAFLLSRSAKVYEGALNVAREMKKVTWPSGEETKHAMKVVIVTTLIVATILFMFDMGSQVLTDAIFSMGSGNKS